MKKQYIFSFVSVLVAFFLFGAVHVRGAVDCRGYKSTSDPIPEGYGAFYHVFTTQKKLLIRVLCSTATATARVTVGIVNPVESDEEEEQENPPLTYTYASGYVWRDSAWETINFTSQYQQIGDWFKGPASANISGISPGSTLYVVGYTCAWVDNQWKCGCRDSVCATSYWQLQKIVMPTVSDDDEDED